MKRFQFPLEAALRFREQQWQAEKAKLETLLAEIEALERRMRVNAGLEIEADEGLRRAAFLSGEELAAFSSYREHLDRERVRLRRDHDERRKKAETQRGWVIEARRRFRLVEKLKERRLAEWSAEAVRELEGQAGELFLARWIRERAD